MTATSRLENLVFGDERPDLILLEQGSIEPAWFAEYETALDAELLASTETYWSRNLVQASHWVSFYLPLRVRFASHTVDVSADTRKQVFNLHIATEQKLFANLIKSVDGSILDALRSEHPLTSSKHEIIRLSLGPGNPTSTHYDSSPAKNWKIAFETNWKLVATDLQSSPRWDKWPIMAARLASFYWDLLFTQNITLMDPIDINIPALKSLLPSSTLAVIHAMLNPADSKIDETGLPIVGTPGRFKQLSVRRLVEPIILAR